jgi:3-oxoadipate enol-lactonase
MSPTHQGFAEINGASLYYETAGAGQPFVMLHGHLLNNHQWDDQFAAFKDTYQVLRYDARGFGQSSLPPVPFSHAADLQRLLEFLELEHLVLMGCSGGGGACIDFTLEHPGMVDALILVGSSLGGYQPSGPMPPKMMAYGQALQSGDLEQALELSLQIFTDGPGRQPGQVNPVARERTRALSGAQFARPLIPDAVPQDLQPPAIERLGEIHAPTLDITGAEDDPMLHDIAAIFAARIPGAKSVVIPDAGHHPNLEHPELFNQIVSTFLSEVG